MNIHRSAGQGLSTACSNMGGMVAPLIFILVEIWRPIPFLVLGCCAICSGLVSLLLPETRGKNLPETLEEGELFGKYVTFTL